MNQRSHYDLVILGSGSTAFAAAIRAQELGKNVLMTEERTTGGTCVNRGCLPSKNLIEAAKIVFDARNPRYPGIAPHDPTFDFAQLVSQKDEIIHSYREKKYETILGDRVEIARGHVQFVDSHTVSVDGRRATGDRILVATGSRPTVPPIDGLIDVPYLTSDLLTADEPIELTALPTSVIIIGGGYIALELGQMFQRFGSDVTILERSAQLLAHGYEPETGRVIQQILEGEGIRILTSAQLRSVTGDSSKVQANVTAGRREQTLRAQRLLIATGRRPNSDTIAIENAGVRVGVQGEIIVDEHLRTNVPHIFAAGDVLGGTTGSEMATPVGSHDGGIAAHNAFADRAVRTVDHRVIPRTIFTDPPIATVGMTEAEAIAAGYPCWCNTLPMSIVPRAAAIRDTRGIIKMVADAKTHEFLGATMIAVGAAEVIHEAAMALRFHATLFDFIDMLHVYPTMSEALKIVAISRFKDPYKLSCCAE
jgi:mercuric reductase